MLKFNSKEEEEFWKQMLLVATNSVSPDTGQKWADWAVEDLRERQQVQSFPDISKWHGDTK